MMDVDPKRPVWVIRQGLACFWICATRLEEAMERRKEVRKPFWSPGRSQETLGGVIQAFHFCGTNSITYFYLWPPPPPKLGCHSIGSTTSSATAGANTLATRVLFCNLLAKVTDLRFAASTDSSIRRRHGAARGGGDRSGDDERSSWAAQLLARRRATGPDRSLVMDGLSNCAITETYRNRTGTLFMHVATQWAR